MVTKFNKWFHCWVEWKDDDGLWKLSVVPWRIVLLVKIFNTSVDFNWKWVPPWKIKIDTN